MLICCMRATVVLKVVLFNAALVMGQFAACKAGVLPGLRKAVQPLGSLLLSYCLYHQTGGHRSLNNSKPEWFKT